MITEKDYELTSEYRPDQSNEWVTTKSLDDKSILEYGKELLQSPTFTLHHPEWTTAQPLYSKKQMLDMFRLGIKISKTLSRKEMQALRKKKNYPVPYMSMRAMNKGEEDTYPYELWSSCRTAASKLKKDYGCRFVVKKLGPKGTIGDIRVVRID